VSAPIYIGGALSLSGPVEIIIAFNKGERYLDPPMQAVLDAGQIVSLLHACLPGITWTKVCSLIQAMKPGG